MKGPKYVHHDTIQYHTKLNNDLNNYPQTRRRHTEEISIYLIIWMMQEIIRTSGHSHVSSLTALFTRLDRF